MKGDPLPPDHHFSRYCRPGAIDDGVLLSDAFKLRVLEDHLSINWLEYFEGLNIEEAVNAVREAFIAKGFSLRPNGRFAVLNIGRAKDAILDGSEKEISMLHWPDDAVENWPDDDLDPSHSGIFGYEVSDVEVAVELTALVSEQAIHPAVI